MAWRVRAPQRGRVLARMMTQFRLLMAASIALLAAVSWLADARPLPNIAPAQAPAWEGQTVVVAGWASDIQTQRNGGQRIVLRHDGYGLTATANFADVRIGDWVEATGRLARLSGSLILLVDRLEVQRTERIETVSWTELAANIERFVGGPLRLRGSIIDGRLDDGRGHSLALGPGYSASQTPLDVDGILAYDSFCYCHRLTLLPRE